MGTITGFRAVGEGDGEAAETNDAAFATGTSASDAQPATAGAARRRTTEVTMVERTRQS
ncbi:hypothetical protein Acor_76060 [Acrocarpospora corrugata]|uniref:Uncharacterized protein n=1 Tax=Acrocarpospora corrugata TaxID=35763 RepID=A0A5M3WGL5_9ACTN|nr:hypothetical protein Acor_76060 [Acrocarpospora corrugata]